jgi:hypothetical protein
MRRFGPKLGLVRGKASLIDGRVVRWAVAADIANLHSYAILVLGARGVEACEADRGVRAAGCKRDDYAETAGSAHWGRFYLCPRTSARGSKRRDEHARRAGSDRAPGDQSVGAAMGRRCVVSASPSIARTRAPCAPPRSLAQTVMLGASGSLTECLLFASRTCSAL